MVNVVEVELVLVVMMTIVLLMMIVVVIVVAVMVVVVITRTLLLVALRSSNDRVDKGSCNVRGKVFSDSSDILQDYKRRRNSFGDLKVKR